jgi:hypothetical protein
MKKILSHLTGIVFLITILFTGGCGSKTNRNGSVCTEANYEKVTIIAKIYEVDDQKLLLLYDPDKPDCITSDVCHVAGVCPNTEVFWEVADDSGIEKFIEISPVNPGIIMKEPASKISDKKFSLKVPSISPSQFSKEQPIIEKYRIVFVSKGGETITRDPYLKIPPDPQ